MTLLSQDLSHLYKEERRRKMNLFDTLLKIKEEQTINTITLSCSGGVNADNPTELTTADLNESLKYFLDDKKPFFKSDLTQVLTPPCFFGVACLQAGVGLTYLKDFIPSFQYPHMKLSQVSKNEFGAVKNIRFLLSTDFTYLQRQSSKLGADEYDIFLVAILSEGVKTVNLRATF
jgi:hypothetical protein